MNHAPPPLPARPANPATEGLPDSGPPPRLIIVTPVYEDVEACTRFFSELSTMFDEHTYIVAVDDGSVMQPLTTAPLEDAGLRGVVIRLTRNIGHQRAIAVGLAYVADRVQDDPAIVVMDSDGEDMPGSISSLLQRLAGRDIDVVVAERKRRVESLGFRMFYAIYRLAFGLLSGRKIRFGNFMAMRVHALRRLVTMQELWVHLAATVLASKLRLVSQPLDRGTRYAGTSKMNFVSLALHGFRGLMVFAEDVLVRVGIACTGIASLSVIGVAAAVMLKLMGYATPGWFSVALGIMLLVFLQTGTLTLVTLMLTGVVRGGGLSQSRYYDYIQDVLVPRQRPFRGGTV